MIALFALACSTPEPVAPVPETPVAPEAPVAPVAPAAPSNVVTTRSTEVPSDLALLEWLAGSRFDSDLVFLEFQELGKVVMTWNAMKGEPVVGKVRVLDEGIEIAWDTDAKNTLNQVYRMVPTSTCTLALTYQRRRVGPEITDPVEFRKRDCTAE